MISQFLGLHHANCLEILRQIPDNSIDLAVEDPPYGISFMGKAWDIDVPSLEIWQEQFRVLKPGAFLLAMSAARQDVHCKMVSRIAEAGFEIAFSPILWCYATGFPKAMHIGRAVDKKLGAKRDTRKVDTAAGTRYSSNAGNHRPWMDNPEHEIACGGPVTPEATELEGAYAGMQLKPAFEPVIVAMKPLSESGYLAQAMATGKGVTWLDGCRIPFANTAEADFIASEGTRFRQSGSQNQRVGEWGLGPMEYSATSGRFPANLLVSDGALDDGRVLKSGMKDCGRYAGSGSWSGPFAADGARCYGDEGSFSRYFSLDSWWEERIRTLPPEMQAVFPFIIEPKPAKSEKDLGLDHLPERRKVFNGQSVSSSGEMKDVEARFSTSMRNTHPTVKSIALMSWLITLASRPGDVVLDPFCGSGSTLLAAEMLDRRWIGCELEESSYAIARARIEYLHEHVRRAKSARLPGMESAAPVPMPKARKTRDQGPSLFEEETA